MSLRRSVTLPFRFDAADFRFDVADSRFDAAHCHRPPPEVRSSAARGTIVRRPWYDRPPPDERWVYA